MKWMIKSGHVKSMVATNGKEHLRVHNLENDPRTGKFTRAMRSVGSIVKSPKTKTVLKTIGSTAALAAFTYVAGRYDFRYRPKVDVVNRKYTKMFKSGQTVSGVKSTIDIGGRKLHIYDKNKTYYKVKIIRGGVDSVKKVVPHVARISIGDIKGPLSKIYKSGSKRISRHVLGF